MSTIPTQFVFLFIRFEYRAFIVTLRHLSWVYLLEGSSLIRSQAKHSTVGSEKVEENTEKKKLAENIIFDYRRVEKLSSLKYNYANEYFKVHTRKDGSACENVDAMWLRRRQDTLSSLNVILADGTTTTDVECVRVCVYIVRAHKLG